MPSILNSISGDSDLDLDPDTFELPALKRKGLLPPIQLQPTDSNFLPGKLTWSRSLSLYADAFLWISLTAVAATCD